MSKNLQSEDQKEKILTNTWWVVAVWTVLLGILLVLDITSLEKAGENLAIREAQVLIQKDEAFRFWAATHGGFYVPIDDRTPPSPYLAHIPEQNIETPSGVQLTLIDPVYALRQMNEIFSETYGVAGHITSLQPLRPENAPDDWERLALESFENGMTETIVFTELAGQPFLRLMQPLITQEGCLKCHAQQGYEVGDVRGGVSVSVPLSAYITEQSKETKTHILSYTLAWLLGIGSIIYISRSLKRTQKQEIAQKLLEESYDHLEERVVQRTEELDRVNQELQARIAEQTLAEKEILASRNQLDSIYRASPSGIGMVIDRNFQFVNDRFAEMLGYTVDELVGKLARIVYPSDLEFERVGKVKYDQIEEKGVGTLETVMQKKDGSIINVLLSSAPIDVKDLSKGVTFTAFDISENIQERETINRLARIVEDSINEIFLFDADTLKFTEVNNAAQKNLGYTMEELSDLTPIDIKPLLSNDVFEELVLPLREGEKDVIAFETLHERKNKTRYNVEVHLQLLEFEGGTSFAAIILDITERVRAEEENRQMEAQLRQHQKLESIGTLASGVAHEINNPITGIMNYAQLIHDRLDPAENQLHEFSTGIINETKRVTDIVSNLLAFSRQDKQSHSPARMTDIVEDTLSLIRTILHHDQIELEVNLPDDLPEFKCRSQQIQQVLMNLLTNARDSLNERYPEYDADKVILLSVNQFEKDGHRWLRTTVEDHGVAVPEEIRERLFDPFFTTKDRTKGTGLGLSISLGIAKDHHGELTFESIENKYTRFYLDIPVDNGWDL